MRNNWIVFLLLLFALLSTLSYCSARGFAEGGGVVRVLSDDVSARSLSGDAIAVKGDGNIINQLPKQQNNRVLGTIIFLVFASLLLGGSYTYIRKLGGGYDKRSNHYIELLD